MRRRPKLIAILTRTFTGLMTVWCLGCSGFDPVLGALFGAKGSVGMNCASEMGAPASDGRGEQSVAVGSADEAGQSDAGFDCGCGSCHAASPVQWNATVDRPTSPRVASLRAVEPMSITRAPVAPPPEMAA